MAAPTSDLVSADWLLHHYQDGHITLVDATWFAPFNNPIETGRQAYAREHIPGAIYFDIDEIADKDSPLAHMLPPPEDFATHMQGLGIAPADTIIIYDRNRFFASARVWWMLRTIGCRAHVLDGGLNAWITAGGPLTNQEEEPGKAPAFNAHFDAALFASTETIKATSDQIIDARPRARFTAEAPEPRAGTPSGHIPNSLSLPGAQLLTGDGYLKPRDELIAAFKSADIDPFAPAIASCGSGVTAGIIALALSTLGNTQVSLYDGSWTEWASDPDNPIAKGPP